MTSTSTVLSLGAGWHVIAQTKKTATVQWFDGVTALLTGDIPIAHCTAKLHNDGVVIPAMNPAHIIAAWTAVMFLPTIGIAIQGRFAVAAPVLAV